MAPPGQRGLLVAYAAFGVFWGGWGALLPAVKVQSGASEAQLGLALLCIAVAALPAMFAMGLAFDRLGRRTLAPALVAFGVTAALPALAHSVAQLAATLLILGVASGALDIAINSSVAAHEVEHGQRLMNKAHAAFPLGALVASVSVGLAREAGAGPPLVLGVIAAVLCAAALWNMRPGPPPRAERPRRSRPRVSGFLLLIGAMFALASLVENALEQWSALHLEQTLSAGPAVSGLGPGLFSAALFAGRALVQSRGEGVSERRLVGVAGAGSAVGIAIAAAAPSPAIALIGFVLAGVTLAVAAPALIGLVGRTAPSDERGSSVATVTAVGYLGYITGPPLIGAASGLAGLRVALAGVALAALMLMAAAPLASGRQKRSAP